MKRISATLLFCSLLCAVAQPLAVTEATAQQQNQEQGQGQDQGQDPADATQRALFSKTDAYTGCLNSLSPEIYGARERYFRWALTGGPMAGVPNMPTINGLYTTGDPTGCRESIEMVNDVTPHQPQLEQAATAYITAVTKLYPLTKEVDSYYTNNDFQGDHMARGKALHPAVAAAFDEFYAADQKLRNLIEPINDDRARQNLAAHENLAGRDLAYEVGALLFDAKTLVNAIRSAPDTARLTTAISQYETSIATISTLNEAARRNGSQGLDSNLVSEARELLAGAKVFLQRQRNKGPPSAADQMFLGNAFYTSGWMVKGSLPNLARNYNNMLASANRKTVSPTLTWVPLNPADNARKGSRRR